MLLVCIGWIVFLNNTLYLVLFDFLGFFRKALYFIKFYLERKEFLKLAISVIDFYRKIEDKETLNPFIGALQDPTFFILAYLNGRVRELTLKLSGEFKCPSLRNFKDFEIESYRSYIIITEFLLGENGERVRKAWGVTEEDFRELIFELYFCLVKEYSTCGFFKKVFLIFVGIWKLFAGRKKLC